MNKVGAASMRPLPWIGRHAGWLAVAVVLGLSLPGCSGGSDKGGSQERRGGTAAGAASKLEGAPPPAPPPPPPTESALPAPAPRPTRPSRPAARNPGNNPAPASPPSATGPARAGSYLFDETGLVKTLGCLVTNQRPPSPTRLNVAEPAGNRQQFDRDQRAPDGTGSSTTSVREYRDDGAYVVSVHQVQAVLQNLIVSDFAPSPPVLGVPSRPVQGQVWGFVLTSTDGNISVDTSNRVEETNESLTLGQGAVVNTVRIRSTAHVTGNSSQGILNFTVTRVTWYARDHHLEVKEITDTAGRVGLCGIDFHTEALARSV